MSEKSHTGLGRQPLASREDLQRNGFAFELNDLGQGSFAVPVLDDGQIAKLHIPGSDLQDIPNDGQDFGVVCQLSKHEFAHTWEKNGRRRFAQN